MKLIIDDIRSASEVFQYRSKEELAEWYIARTSDEALIYLKSGNVTHVSFDNDLGLGQLEGRRILAQYIDMIMEGRVPRPEWIGVHSWNFIAAKEMWLLIDDLNKCMPAEREE